MNLSCFSCGENKQKVSKVFNFVSWELPKSGGSFSSVDVNVSINSPRITQKTGFSGYSYLLPSFRMFFVVVCVGRPFFQFFGGKRGTTLSMDIEFLNGLFYCFQIGVQNLQNSRSVRSSGAGGHMITLACRIEHPSIFLAETFFTLKIRGNPPQIMSSPWYINRSENRSPPGGGGKLRGR